METSIVKWARRLRIGLCYAVRCYSDITRTPWSAIQLFGQQCIQANIKENCKSPNYWSFVGNPQVTYRFPSQRASNAENDSTCNVSTMCICIQWNHTQSRHNNYQYSVVLYITQNKKNTERKLYFEITKFTCLHTRTDWLWRIDFEYLAKMTAFNVIRLGQCKKHCHFVEK